MRINKWCKVGLLFVIVTALINGGKFFVSIAVATLIIFILEIIFITLCKKSIDIKNRTTTFKITCGEEIIIKYEVENKFRMFIPYISVNSSVMKKSDKELMYSSMLPKKNNIIEERISFNYRGIYDIGSKVISIKGVWGIVTMTYTKKNKEVIIVTPKTYLMQQRYYGILGNSEKCTRSIVGESNDIKNIRKYREGDTVKRINWKCSAKSHKLMVNEYEDKVGDTNCILVDMNVCNFDLDPLKEKEEAMIDFAMSFCKNMLSIGLRCNIFVNNRKLEKFTVDNKEGYLCLEDYFIKNESNGRNDILKTIKQELSNISSGTGLIIVINKLDEGLLNEIKKNFSHGKNNITIIFNSRDSILQCDEKYSKFIRLIQLEKNMEQNGV